MVDGRRLSWTPERRAKAAERGRELGKANRGRHPSQETIAKIRAWWTEERRREMSRRKTGA